MDVLDPSHIPGLLYPAHGGTDLDTLTGVLTAVLATGRVAALGIGCTWTPGHRAAPIARELLTNLLDQRQGSAGVPRPRHSTRRRAPWKAYSAAWRTSTSCQPPLLDLAWYFLATLTTRGMRRVNGQLADTIS
jgi:hypothetical protein